MHPQTGYTLHHDLPDIADYLRLREVCGLTPRSRDAAAAGLPASWFAATLRHGGRTIGMGRVVGDGALFLQVVDVMVDPDHQGRGLGKVLMGAIMAHIKATVPAEVHVSLLADGPAQRLYGQFGFATLAPAAEGMAIWIGRD